MYKVKVTIKGLSALRYNRFNVERNTTGTSKKMNEEQKAEEVWERAYINKDGFYLPRHALKTSIINGAKKVKLGRGSASASLKAILIFDKDEFPAMSLKDKQLKRKDGDYVIMTDVVRIPPRTGARVVQRWVALPEWQCTFDFIIVDDVVHPDTIKESINFAGLYQGLLDGRPEYGRFEMTSFEKYK